MTRPVSAHDIPLAKRALERWVSQCPDRVGSVGIDGSALTWAEIATSVRTLDGRLRQAGTGPGDRIAVMAGRSRYALSSLLAVWANGSSAVLLDERHPAERLRWTVRDAGCSALVSSESEPNAAELGLALIETTGSETRAAAESATGTGAEGAERPPAGTGLHKWTLGPGASEAYVVYTSGTTGRPKGVRIGTAALEHFLANAETLGYRPGSRAVSVVSPGFDGWLWSVLTPFVNGVTCVAVDPAFGQLEDALAAQEIDNLCMTPSLYAAMEKLPRAEVAVVAGERCPDALVARLKESADRVLNVYGPTEATIATTMADTARGDDPRTIGRPMPGCTVTVVDADLNEVPPGATGELLIGGAGVALGYVGADAPGADRFLDRDGARYFRTGDRGMLRADGQVSCLGRMDNQVKIGGFRIELEDIESIACAVPGIERAVAYVRGEPGTLALGVLTASGGPLDADLRERLTHEFASRLPRQLCPTRLHRMAEVPLEATGKVARQSVAELGDRELSGGGHDGDGAWDRHRQGDGDRDGGGAEGGGADFAGSVLGGATRQPVLDSVMEAWSSVFGRSVAEDDDFFAIGGHSLLAAQLASRIELQLEVAVSITDVLTAGTPRALADRIEEARAA